MMASEAPGHIRSPIDETDTISLRGDCYGCTSDRIVGSTLPRLSLAEVGCATAHLCSQLILAFAQVHNVPEQAVRCPLDKTHFDDHFRAHPMHPREHER